MRRLEWYVARRYLSSRKGSRFLSLITLIAIGGVGVGVMALIIVTSVMTGLQNHLREAILGTNPHIWVITSGQTLRMEGWQAPLEEIREVPGVVAAAPFIHTEVGLRNAAGYAEFAILRGIDPDQPGEPITDIIRKLRAGDLSLQTPDPEYPPLLLGRTLAGRFGVFRGDTVTVISLTGTRMTPMGTPMPNQDRFIVAGIFETGMYEYDNKFMYTSLPVAQHLTEMGGDVTGIEVRVRDEFQAQAIGDEIERRLGFPFRADDWTTMNAALFSALKLEKLAMAIILGLIVVVAAFNIISTLVMVVADKTREIGILKSMGMTSRQIRRIFMLQGVVIGVVGAALGAAGGVGLTYILDRYRFISIPGDVYLIDYLPVAIDWRDLAVILVLSVVVSFVATVHPARQAAGLLPVEAIRHD
jgi:lipoprotein-releasing system permease protein